MDTKNTLNPIDGIDTSKDTTPKKALRSRYRDMSQELSKHPDNVSNKHIWLLRKIFELYEEDKGSIVFENGGKWGYFIHDGKSFTNFGVILLDVVKIHDLNCTVNYVTLLILSKFDTPYIIRVDARKLGSFQWFESLDVSYICEKREIERLKNLIQIMSEYAPVKNEYAFSGWSPNGDNLYILNGLPLQFDTFDRNTAKCHCKHTIGMLSVASHSLTIPLLSIALLSLVHSQMIETGTFFKGVCCIVAPTQSFKTTLAALFFDHNSGTEANTNFEATAAAIIRTIGNTRDSTVIVDDYKPGATKAESKDLLLKLGKIIRMCSDASGGIQKAGIQNSTISNTASCLVVVTAEEVQLNVQSSLARLLILETNRKAVDRDNLTYFQANHCNYKAFLKDFLMYIGSQGVKTYCENLANKFLTQRNTLMEKVSAKGITADNRTSDMCTWLIISFFEFLQYSRYVNAITQEQFNCLAAKAENVFVSIMEQQAERVADLDDTRRFFKGLQVLLETNEANIAVLRARNTGYFAFDSKAAIGFEKKDFIYLKNGVALQAVISYYRRYGKEFYPSESTLRKSLGNKGCILPYSEKTFIHRLYVNKEKYQCIKFQKNQFYKLLNGGKENAGKSNQEVSDNRGILKNANMVLGRDN